jgi:hypothetical protein
MFEKLDNEELLAETKKLVAEEKRLTHTILGYLEETQTRRLFALRGYSSMFEFCMLELGYSESAANRRISAMRLIRDLPEAKKKLQEGAVNLSTLSQLHRFIKIEEKQKKTKLGAKERGALLRLIENKSQSACEREFVKLSPAAAGARQSIRPLSEDLTEVTFVASKELMAKLDILRNRMAHKGVSRISELVEALADMALKQGSKSTSAAEVRNDTGRPEETLNSSFRDRQKLAGKSRYIPAKIRAHIWRRDENCCQYADPLTNRKCLSRYGLQIDHIIPFAKGGTADPDNLRLLCRAHNQLLAIQNFSSGHMLKYIPSLK